jgi:ketosteroid isomerase-like protein
MEYEYDVEVTTTGQAFTVPNILVIRVRDGRIVASRDYHDHHVMRAALS